LPRKLDAVIHLAQSRFYKQFPDKAADVFAVNVYGTFQLLEYARQVEVEHFVFASSGGVYGYGSRPFVEGDPTDPPNFYLCSKCAAEQLVSGYRSFFRTAILRLFAVYGPGQREMLVAALAHRIENGEPVTIEGNPGLRLSLTYIEDVVDAVEAALVLPTPELINVAGDEDLTISELAQLIADVADRPLEVRYVPGGPPGGLVADNSRMREVLRVQPRTPVRRGLSSVIEAARGSGLSHR
jgi:nucleoside-diphosphate-sugar epimerase